jgi:hypothetical protein
MATLVINHAGSSKTIDDPDFADLGGGALRLGNDAAVAYMNWLGDAWEDETSVKVGDKTYQSCTADVQPEGTTLYHGGVRTDADEPTADQGDDDEGSGDETEGGDESAD